MFVGIFNFSEVNLKHMIILDQYLEKIAEIKLLVPGNDLFAKRQCKTFEEATDQAVEALRRQLKKKKEKAMP